MNESVEIARLCPPWRAALLNAHTYIVRAETVLSWPWRWLMDNVITSTSVLAEINKQMDAEAAKND